MIVCSNQTSNPLREETLRDETEPEPFPEPVLGNESNRNEAAVFTQAIGIMILA